MELNLYGRAMEARRKKEEDTRRQQAVEAERLARMVSWLVGETVKPQNDELVYKLSDRQHIVFTFADGSKDKLANQWTCDQCRKLYRTPIEDLASLEEPLRLAYKGDQPPHEGCPGIASNERLIPIP